MKLLHYSHNEQSSILVSFNVRLSQPYAHQQLIAMDIFVMHCHMAPQTPHVLEIYVLISTIMFSIFYSRWLFLRHRKALSRCYSYGKPLIDRWTLHVRVWIALMPSRDRFAILTGTDPIRNNKYLWYNIYLTVVVVDFADKCSQNIIFKITNKSLHRKTGSTKPMLALWSSLQSSALQMDPIKATITANALHGMQVCVTHRAGPTTLSIHCSLQ